MRRALAGAVIAAIALTGCGNNGTEDAATDTPSAGDTAAPTPTPTDAESTVEPEGPSEDSSDDGGKDDAIEIEIEGDEIAPNGELIKVRVGEAVKLELESDRRGELHVHATPEQELDFGRGRTSLEVTIDTPGVVDVEEHESGVVILQLQVR